MSIRTITPMDTIYSSIKAKITFSRIDYSVELTGDDIVRYKIDNNLCSEGLPIGVAASSSFTLEMRELYRNDVVIKSPEYIGAKVEVFLYMGETDPNPPSEEVLEDIESIIDAIESNNAEATSESDSVEVEYKPFGVWFVEETENVEQSDYITLSGCDILGWKGQDDAIDDSNSESDTDNNPYAVTYVTSPEYTKYERTTYGKFGSNKASYKANTTYNDLRSSLEKKYGIKFSGDMLCGDIHGFTNPFAATYLIDRSKASNPNVFNNEEHLSKMNYGFESETPNILQQIVYLAAANMGFARVNWSGEIEIRTIGWAYPQAGNFVKDGTVAWSLGKENGEYVRIKAPKDKSFSTRWVIGDGFYVEYSDSGGGEIDIDSVYAPNTMYIVGGRVSYSYFNRIASQETHIGYAKSYKYIQLPRSPYTQTAVNAEVLVIEDDALDGQSHEGTIWVASDELTILIAEMWLSARFEKGANRFRYSSGSIKWFGHPEFMPGDEIVITTLDGKSHSIVSTHTSITFDSGGLMTEVSGNVPIQNELVNRKYSELS